MGFCYFLLTLMLTPQGLSSGYLDDWKDYDYPNYNYLGEGTDPPSFVTHPQSFTVEVGQSVVIPCVVDKPESKNKIIIKKVPANGASEKLLSVGREKVTPDARVTVDGSGVTITHVLPRDAGTFLCQIDLEPPLLLRHSLEVQYAAAVRALVPPEQRVVRGGRVVLECAARGNPVPSIRWSRQDGTLPSGQYYHQGHRLVLEAVERHMDGTYLCTADNGVGEPASAAVTITVEYPPEVTTERAIVRTGEGDNVELVCVVHGLPPPEVSWSRDGHPLPDTMMDTRLHFPYDHQQQQEQQYQQQQKQQHLTGEEPQFQQTEHYHNYYHHYQYHQQYNQYPLPPPGAVHTAHGSQTYSHRHTLTISHVTEKDFGAYVCIAENVHGQKNAVIQMTGLPKPPQVNSSPNEGDSSRYSLTWETESYYPLTEYLIRYRKTHLGTYHSDQSVIFGGSWQNVSRPVDDDDVGHQGSRLLLTHTLQHLQVATDYVAVVRVRNKYGWSAESDTIYFSTKKEMRVLESTSEGTQLYLTPVVCLLAAAVCLTVV
nr:hemicentin-2-like [Cherax quadricarinatus]